MYRLIIIDDEEEVRKGVIKKIEWEKYGFEVVGEAENGREALEVIEKTKPDLIITDIKMPFMDGLQLCKELMRDYPTTKVIILTGFDEFEYAQKAVKYNVVEYALKPVSSIELIEILEKVKAKLDKEIEEKEDLNYLKNLYIKSLPILKERFLTTLITRNIDKDEIIEKINDFDLNIKGNLFVISVLSIDTNSFDCEKKEWNFDYLKLAVLNIADEIAKKYNLGNTFIHNDNIIMVISFDSNERDTNFEKLFPILEEIRVSIEKYLKFTVTIGVGTMCDIDSLRNSYINALSAVDYKLVEGNNRIIYIDDVDPKPKDIVVFDDIKENLIISSIKVGTEKEIRNAIEIIFKDLVQSKSSYDDYHIYLMEVITAILKASRSVRIEMKEVFGETKNIFAQINRFSNLEEIKEWIINICIKIMNFISNDRVDTFRIIVSKAEDYIKLNYHEKDMNINKICKYLHISPTYFSSIFKKETDKTFINYLTQIRMEAAKELLRTTNLKTFEIAEKVGYTEQNYFSYSFKKNFGISPSSYRNGFKTS